MRKMDSSDPKPKSFKVGRGSFSVTVYPWQHSSGGLMWRFNKLAGDSGKITRRKRARAKEAAEDYLAKLSGAERRLENLPPEKLEILDKIMKQFPDVEKLEQFHAWQVRKQATPPFSELVEKYLSDKITVKGTVSRHLSRVGIALRALSDYCGPSSYMGDITLETLTSWRDERAGDTGPANKNFLRVAASGIWKWAGLHGHISMEQSQLLARMPVIPVPKEDREKAIRYCSNDEALVILREIRREFRMFAVLGLFAGLRPEEISPQKGTKKPGLDFSAISSEDKAIYLPASVSKVGEDRLIPITSCLRSWLAWAGWFPGKTGPVCVFNKKRSEEPKRLGEILNKEFDHSEPWPHDWLRHSYGTYRNALKRSLHQVAEEMGTSVQMMKKHYHQPKPKKLGKSFFSLRPSDLEKGRVIEQKFA